MPNKKARKLCSDVASMPPPTLPPFDNYGEGVIAAAADNGDDAPADADGNDGPDDIEGNTLPLLQLPLEGKKKPKKQVKETVIDHTYRDYSQVEGPKDDESESNGKGASADLTQKSFQSFPAKLHAILSNPNYQHIIRWMPHGRCWTIVDKYLLTTYLLPKYFSHGKFESFNRSVNGWGFKRLLRDGPDKRAYYHECFLRGRPELTKLMSRLCNPGKRLPDKAGEPDLYEISRKYPLPELPQSGGDHPENSLQINMVNVTRSPNAMEAHSRAIQRAFFASPPVHHVPSTNANRNSQGASVSQLPQPIYLPAGPMEHYPAYPQNPFGFYAPPSQFVLPPPHQSMAGGPAGYYVVYQPPPHYVPSPHNIPTMATVQYSAIPSGVQQPDVAALLAASVLTSADAGRKDKPVTEQESEKIKETSDETLAKEELPSQANVHLEHPEGIASNVTAAV